MRHMQIRCFIVTNLREAVSGKYLQQIKIRESLLSLLVIFLPCWTSNPEVLCQIHSSLPPPQPETVFCFSSSLLSFSSSLSHMFCIYTLEVSHLPQTCFLLFIKLEIGLQLNQKLFFMKGKGSIYRSGCLFLLLAP